MYISTRDNHPPVTASQAIYLGMAPRGGLFVPEATPKLTPEEGRSLADLTYPELAERILRHYLDDYTPEEIRASAQAAYGGNFFHRDIAPVKMIEGLGGVLELFHGPTAAFKDMALQLTPSLLSLAMRKGGQGRNMLILVATSGDTGKAALEGFKDIPGVRIACFFPDEGVSRAQELQMRTTGGGNTHVYSVEGNFDDCQNGVKEIFGDAALGARLAERGWQLSSANSINWGRLCPQIVYYFYAYFALAKSGRISHGQQVHFAVPTGNFGNILSAWYAREMGLPIGKLICASNENKVLTDFFSTGLYDRRREFYKTSSPSMDILISSNLERFLFEMNGHDGAATVGYMDEMAKNGCFEIGRNLLGKIQSLIWAGSACEAEAAAEMRRVYEERRYLMDPHTAVGSAVCGKYAQETGDDTLVILDATASPYKFPRSVMEALRGVAYPPDADELRIAEELAAFVGAPIHPALADLDKLPVLHGQRLRQAEMKDAVAAIARGTIGRPPSSES